MRQPCLECIEGRFQLPNYAKFNRPDPQRDWDWLRPHTLNLYEYCSNDPVNAWDPTGFADKVEREEKNGFSWFDKARKVVEGAVTHAIVFSVATANAYSSDQVLGVGRGDTSEIPSQYQTTARLGQMVGDTAALVQGSGEMALGGTLLAGSVSVSPGAVAAAGPTFGASIALDLVAAGTGAVTFVHGGTVTATSAGHLFDNYIALSEGRSGGTIGEADGVRVHHHGTNDAHRPAHAHVTGGGPEVRIGPKGYPLKNQKGNPKLTATQKKVVKKFKKKIRKELNKVGRAQQKIDQDILKSKK